MDYNDLIFVYIDDTQMFVSVNRFDDKDVELQYRKQFNKCNSRAECIKFLSNVADTNLQFYDSRYDIISLSKDNMLYVKNIGTDEYRFKIDDVITTLLPQGYAVIHNMQCISSVNSQNQKCGD